MRLVSRANRRHPPTALCRLLETWIKEARRHGVQQHQVVTWVRRKLGGDVLVWRYTADGTLAVATPCKLCLRELQRFDLRVHCSLGPGAWYSGRLSEPEAPPVGLTSGQRRRFDRPQPLTPQRQTGAVHGQREQSPPGRTASPGPAPASKQWRRNKHDKFSGEPRAPSSLE